MSVLGLIVVRGGYIMSPWLFNVYMDTDEGEKGDGEDGSKISGGRKRVEIA